MTKLFSVEEQSYEIISGLDERSLLEIERVARVCTKTEHLIKDGSDKKLVRKLLTHAHMSPIEFGFDITVKFNVDRGLSHELVRHRLCSHQQKSQRYVDDGGNLIFIKPFPCSQDVIGDWEKLDRPIDMKDYTWLHHCFEVARSYKKLRHDGWPPQYARSVLSNAVKTELFTKTNIRDWINIFDLRCSNKAHPQLYPLMRNILKDFKEAIPVVFNDVYYKYFGIDAFGN